MTRYLRVGLRSREVFRNWFSVGLMYLLYRLGLINNRVIKVILKDGCVTFAELDRFGRVINAYYDGLISGVHCLGNDFYVDFMGLRFRVMR